MNYEDHRRTMLADILSEMIQDTDNVSEVSDAIMDELRDIRDYHDALAEKTALLISYLGG